MPRGAQDWEGRPMSERLNAWSVVQAAIDEAKEVSEGANNGRGQSHIFAFARIARAWKWSNGVPPTAEQVADYLERLYMDYLNQLGVRDATGDFWELFQSCGDPRGEFIAA